MGTQKDIDILLKFGEEKNIRKLFDGEVYLNTIDYFRNNKNPEIGDPLEGNIYVSHIKDQDIFINGRQVKAKDIIVYIYDHLNQNIFCMYGVYNDDSIKKVKDNLLEIDTRKFNGFSKDGNIYCVAISNVPEFVRRITDAIKKMNLEFDMKAVWYYDESKYSGELTPFRKSDRYSHQNEVRLWVKNTTNKPLCLNIGSIKDIATLIPNNSVIRLTYGNQKNSH